MKKKSKTTRNIIIQNETESHVSQLRFSLKQVIIMLLSFSTLIISLVFISANNLSRYIYQSRLDEFKMNYLNVENSIELLNEKIQDINSEITIIEEKDGALRSYAGMPIIDKDIRKLGIGGSVLKPPIFSDNLLPSINEDLSVLEMNIEKIARQVSLEMDSYSSIYEKVQRGYL